MNIIVCTYPNLGGKSHYTPKTYEIFIFTHTYMWCIYIYVYIYSMHKPLLLGSWTNKKLKKDNRRWWNQYTCHHAKSGVPESIKENPFTGNFSLKV
jgi:hypothetical protein